MKNILILLLLCSCGVSAEIYKWTDENGDVHFGDRPAQMKEAQVVEIREQEVGSMVTEDQKLYLERKRTDEKYDSIKRDVESSANAPAAAHKKQQSQACIYAKNILRGYEIDLSQLKRGGYKQSERQQAENSIETWKHKVKTNCE